MDPKDSEPLPDNSATPLRVPGTDAVRPADDRPARVLLVDDDAQHRASLARLVESHGFASCGAASVAAALDVLADTPVDAILLDLNMPGAGGLDLLEQLREGGGHPPPVLVVSAESRLDEVAPAIRLGAFDFHKKPYDPAALVTSLRNAVSQHRQAGELRRMQAMVEQSDRLHRYLVEQSPDIIYMLDADGRFTFVNQAAEAVFQVPRQQLLTRHWSRLFPETELPRATWHFNERRTGERATFAEELHAEPLPQNVVVLEVSAMGIYAGDGDGDDAQAFSGTYGIARDVTRSRDTARDLAQTRERFHSLFQLSPDAIFISHADDGSILEGNRNFERLRELLEPEDAGNDAMFWPGDAAGALSGRKRFVDRLRKSPGGVLHSLVAGPEGRERLLELNAALISLDGDEGILATVRDVTEQKRAESDRLLLEQQLQQSRKMEAIGLLAGGIAHDFNNILASMIGYAELALLPSNDGRSNTGYLEEVISGGQRARDLVAQLLAFSRGHRGEVSAVDVGRTASGVMRMLRAAIPSRIGINMSAAGVAPVAVDPVNLQQVLINLVVNARDAIDGSGNIEVRLDQRHVAGECVSCQQPFDGDWVELEVSDTGAGIDPDLVPHVFELFVTSRVAGKGPGTGMGLSLVHSIVHEAGGHLLLDSTVGQGSRFRLLLPPDGGAVAQGADTKAGDSPQALVPPQKHGRVLVVDDEVSVCNFLAEALRSRGYTVLVRHDGQAALEFLQEDGNSFDLLITDQTMPRLSGVQLAQAAHGLHPDLPIVLCTGHRSALADDSTLPLAAILEKPFSVRRLLDLADTLISSNGDAASRRQA